MIFRSPPLLAVSNSKASGKMSCLRLSESKVLCKTPYRSGDTATLQIIA